MADVHPPVTQPNKREDLTTRRIRVFQQRYGTNALYLACHAAFPLTLTSDLLYCLRENFLPDVPWYTVADVLLSGLCQPAGYDLYEMEAKTRDGLLRCLYKDKKFGEQRLKQLADFMSKYIANRLQVENNDRALVFGQRPDWTALAYLSSDEQELINAIKQELQKLTASTDAKERIRWVALVESYADLLSEKGFEPLLLEWSQQILDGQPIQDEEEKEIAATMGISLQTFEFDVAAIIPDDEPGEELRTFEFDTVTVDARGQVINKERNQAYDAVEFCLRLSQYTGRPYSLPSEAEWEYACRAGTTTPFHFGETLTSELANYDANYTYGAGVKGKFREETTPVGSFGVANAFGLYDMHGNVWEWCLDDWHDNYEDAPTDGSPWFNDNDNIYQKQGKAVLRGGSWINDPNYCRSASRGYNLGAERDYFDSNVGFRVACGVGRIIQ